MKIFFLQDAWGQQDQESWLYASGWEQSNIPDFTSYAKLVSETTAWDVENKRENKEGLDSQEELGSCDSWSWFRHLNFLYK